MTRRENFLVRVLLVLSLAFAVLQLAACSDSRFGFGGSVTFGADGISVGVTATPRAKPVDASP
jgi:hypothetical protein